MILTARKSGLALGLIAAFLTPGFASARIDPPLGAVTPAPTPRYVPTPAPAVAPGTDNPKQFPCQGGGKLLLRIESGNRSLVAIVDAGDGPHSLPVKPWDGGEPNVTWSDGRRTLVWTTGVQLMFMDGPTHLMCGLDPNHDH